jgi:polyphosphate glucokinase
MEILGIDIGGSGIKGAIVNVDKGELVTERHRIPTPQPATPSAVVDTVASIVEEFKWKGQMGCGFPAAVKHDVVKTASNIDKSWIGLNAAKKIEAATGCTTHLVNDVDAAGYAEMKYGAGKGHRGTVIMVAAGTGIGTSLFAEGVLFPNSELGFVRLKDCIPGEHYAANSVRKKEDLSWEEWGNRFNEYLTRVESLFWPDLFIIGGGISKKFDEFSQYLTCETKIVPAQTRNHAGIIGAAVAAHHIEKHQLHL